MDRAQAALAVLGDVNVTQAERDVAAQEAADAVGLLSLPASWRVEP